MKKLTFLFCLLAPLTALLGSSTFCQSETLPEFFEEEPCKNWDLFAELLVWHMGEVGTIPNSTIKTTFDPNLTTELNLNNFAFGWDFGYRLGGRYYNIGKDQWGLTLAYTWFRTEAKSSGTYDGYVGIPTGFPLTGTISDADFLSLFWLFGAHSYQSRWSLLYNLFDFAFDREYWASTAISLRPYLGLRGGWIRQNIHISSVYFDANSNNFPVPAKEVLNQHFWGIGPSMGIDSRWFLGNVGKNCFYLFGDLSAAFMSGYWTFANDLKIGTSIHGDLFENHTREGVLMFQDLLGFEWNVALNCKGALCALRLGFETQFWFDHLQIFNTYNGKQHNALTLQGGTLDLRFNY